MTDTYTLKDIEAAIREGNDCSRIADADTKRILDILQRPAFVPKVGQVVAHTGRDGDTDYIVFSENSYASVFLALAPEEMGMERFKHCLVSSWRNHDMGFNDAIDHVNKTLGFE